MLLNLKIPTGLTTTGWEGLAAYESADGEGRPITDASAQVPVGVIEDVDLDSGYISVRCHGWVKGGILPGAAVDLSGQRAASGNWGCANDSGEGIGATTGNFRLGFYDSKPGDVVDAIRHPFFVSITGEKFA